MYKTDRKKLASINQQYKLSKKIYVEGLFEKLGFWNTLYVISKYTANFTWTHSVHQTQAIL